MVDEACIANKIPRAKRGPYTLIHILAGFGVIPPALFPKFNRAWKTGSHASHPNPLTMARVWEAIATTEELHSIIVGRSLGEAI
jgi:hypothetical protein